MPTTRQRLSNLSEQYPAIKAIKRLVRRRHHPSETPSDFTMKVFDVFPFYNEIELLQVRLRELDGVVDHHVLIEAHQTHRGLDKPLVFDANRRMFDRWRDRITDLAVELPDGPDPWARERFQRDSGLAALAGLAGPTDLIISTDVDEIPRANALLRIAGGAYLYGRVSLSMRAHYFESHWWDPKPWVRPKAFVWGAAPTSLTDLRLREDLPTVPGAGWHLSYFMNEVAVHDKLSAFAHAEFDTAEWHAQVPRWMAEGHNMWGKLETWDGSDMPSSLVGNHGPGNRDRLE